MEAIERKAEQRGVPVDSVLNAETDYFIRMRPDLCYPALNDSVPTKRSARAEHYISLRHEKEADIR